MISRGIIIGKVVDDFASLAYQINTRNKLGQFDLTKICEDFIREVLNITLDLNLKNLNKLRSNNPGLDLGDKDKEIAIQVTSDKTSAKINETLEAIIDEQKSSYKKIRIFILGYKQNSYSIKRELSKKFKFKPEEHIWDIDSILKEIVSIEIDKLEMLYNLFNREFRQVKIELEPLDEKGNYESSYYNLVEKKPTSPAKNGLLFLGEHEKHHKRYLREINNLYERLALIPRVTREILAIIVDKGKYEDGYRILPEALERFLRIDEKELLAEVNILENYNLTHIEEDSIGEREVRFIAITDEFLNQIFNWLIDEKLSIRTFLNTMNFTVLDK